MVVVAAVLNISGVTMEVAVRKKKDGDFSIRIIILAGLPGTHERITAWTCTYIVVLVTFLWTWEMRDARGESFNILEKNIHSLPHPNITKKEMEKRNEHGIFHLPLRV